jgi:hypothetical protein
MKRLLTVAALAVACSIGLVAAPVACPEHTTLGALISLNGSGADSGCQTQDKIFNNFSYSGGGDVLASDIFAHLIFQPGPNTQDIHGWNFAPVGGPWTENFTLAYDISVAPGGGLLAIVAAKDQINSGFLPNGVVATDVQTPNSGGSYTIITRGQAGQETSQMAVANATSIRTVSSVSFSNSSDLLASYEQTWFQSQVPEPFSMSLIGGGLLLLGLTRFRKKA